MEPLFFTPHLAETLWGGTALSKEFGKYTGNQKIGESWELSASARGQSTVRRGLFTGVPLAELFTQEPHLFGIPAGTFPLTIKLIDAQEQLSVQVHGDPTGRMGPEANQNEAWVIIKADPGAQIVLGSDLKTGTALEEALAKNEIEAHLRYWSVSPGEVIFVPTGTLHAIGAGILLYEISQADSVTYRFYDWGRGREIQIHEACKAYCSTALYGKVAPVPLGKGRKLLLKQDCFVLEEIDASEIQQQETASYFQAYTALSPGQIQQRQEVFPYTAGDTFIIPANFGGFTLQGGVLLKAYAPA